MHEERFDVAVVGYGPTGLVLASLLGQMGHRVVVVERWPTLYGLPRLTHIDGETARVLSFACDIDYALRDSSPLTSYLFLDANGRTLVDSSARPEPSMGFPAHISIHQPDIEDAMDKQIRQLTNVTLKQGVTLAGVRLELNEAYLTVRTQDKNETLRAKFVFGADGARSQVRSSLGIGLEDFGFNERWLNVDSERKRDLPAKFNRTTQFCDPRRGYMFMPIGKTRQRFEFALLRNEDMDTMQSPSTAWRLLGQYHGISSDDISIIRQIVYTFECRLAETWRQGVALLGGMRLTPCRPILDRVHAPESAMRRISPGNSILC
ncbi:FAD-dependent monooxygenase [Bradyrhizobium sp. RDM4]|uniref:FAD-dependent monooxygenase n=1 Tax=Bradyrhizobium sp. RDM4 TaxID=3378765 RepID=UPI0038FC88EB